MKSINTMISDNNHLYDSMMSLSEYIKENEQNSDIDDYIEKWGDIENTYIRNREKLFHSLLMESMKEDTPEGWIKKVTKQINNFY